MGRTSMRFRRYELIDGYMQENIAGQWAEHEDVGLWFRRYELQAQHAAHLREHSQKLVSTLASIHMRCAPADFKVEGGRTMRFVPPDPEMYWRELSSKVNGIIDELTAIGRCPEPPQQAS